MKPNEPSVTKVDAPRVIVAEDDPTARAMLGAWLHTEGCIYELHSTAADAAAALATREFDLLLSDVQLPDRDGPDLAAGIEGVNRGLPVVFLTGSPTLETAMRSVRVRAVAYLVKPPNLTELRAIVHREAAAHRARRAVASSRHHLVEWDGELARLEQVATAPGERGPGVDYVKITVRHLGLVLSELDRSVSLMGADPATRDALAQVDLLNGLRRTVSVLERTREHFKSKDLGELRKDLEGLLRRIDGAAK